MFILLLNLRPFACHEMPRTNHPVTQRDISEEWRPRLLREIVSGSYAEYDFDLSGSRICNVVIVDYRCVQAWAFYTLISHCLNTYYRFGYNGQIWSNVRKLFSFLKKVHYFKRRSNSRYIACNYQCIGIRTWILPYTHKTDLRVSTNKYPLSKIIFSKVLGVMCL